MLYLIINCLSPEANGTHLTPHGYQGFQNWQWQTFSTGRQQVWWREISSFSDLLSVTFIYLLMQSYLLFLHWSPAQISLTFIIYHIHEDNQTPKILSHYPIVKQLLWQLKQPKLSSHQDESTQFFRLQWWQKPVFFITHSNDIFLGLQGYNFKY